MAEKNKTKIWVQRIVILMVIVAAVGAGAYWYIFNIKFDATKDAKATYTVNALDLIHEFEANDSASNKKYADQIVTVNGRVSETEAADSTINIKMIDTTKGSYIIFAFQTQYLDEAKTLKSGDSVSIKGSCSGGAYSEILETEYITFKRCTLNK